MIQTHSISLRYKDDVALDNINLHIKKGRMVCILGPSGSGKSSLLSILSGVKKPTHGHVLIEGMPLLKPRLKTSTILQDYGLLPWKCVYNNISFPFKTHGIVDGEKRIHHYAGLLGIDEYYRRFPHQLSGGQKQRVAIARALCLNSDLLLMDEAFSALDFATKEGLQDLLLNIHEEEKQTIVFVTHSIEEAVYLGQDIIILEQGKVKAQIENKLWKNRDDESLLSMYKKVRGLLYD